jgi:hypothetical protein
MSSGGEYECTVKSRYADDGSKNFLSIDETKLAISNDDKKVSDYEWHHFLGAAKDSVSTEKVFFQHPETKATMSTYRHLTDVKAKRTLVLDIAFNDVIGAQMVYAEVSGEQLIHTSSTYYICSRA